MSEQNDRRRRVSLRGKGREILTGGPPDEPPDDGVDARALRLTPQEAASLWALEAASADESVASPMLLEDGDLIPAWQQGAPEVAGDLPAASEPSDPAPDAPADLPEAEEPVPDVEQAVAGARDGVTGTIEQTPDPEDLRPYFLPEFDRIADLRATTRTVEEEESRSPETLPDAGTLPAPEISGPPPGERLPVAYGYAGLATVIDDEMLRRFLAQIEALQDDLAQALEFDPAVVEAWQRQLFEAHVRLVQSRANYEAARMAVVGIQTEMNRQRRVRADVMRYRPLLLNYLVGWGIGWVVLMALKSMVAGIADTIGLTLVAAAYYPALFGVLGALVGSYLALERHAIRQRDFDPLYITGYLANPLLGGAAGLLVFLAFGLANHHVLDGTTTDLERIVLWITAAVVGLNQSAILRRVAALFPRNDPGSPG